MRNLCVAFFLLLSNQCQIDSPINLVIKEILVDGDSLCITAMFQNQSNETIVLYEIDDYNLPAQVNQLQSIPKEFKCFEPIVTYGISILLTDSAGKIMAYRDDEIPPLKYENDTTHAHEISFSRLWVDRRDSVRAGKCVLKKGQIQKKSWQISISKFGLISGTYKCQLVYVLGSMVFDFVKFETDVFQGCVKSEAVSIQIR